MSQLTVEDTLSHVLHVDTIQEEEDADKTSSVNSGDLFGSFISSCNEEKSNVSPSTAVIQDADKTSSVNSGDLFGCSIPPCIEEESNVPSSTADIQDCYSEDISADITSPEVKSLLEKDNIKSQPDNDFETFNSKVPCPQSSKSGGESEDCTAINSGNESQVKLNVEERTSCARSGLIVLRSSQPHHPNQPMKDEAPKEADMHRLLMPQSGEGIYVNAASPFTKAPMLDVPMNNIVYSMDTPTSDDERFSSVDSNGYARIKDIVDTIELYRLTSEDDLEKASSGYSSEYSSGYARTKDIVDTVYPTPDPNDDYKPLKPRPNTSPKFPLPQLPTGQSRPFSEGDADQGKTDLSQDVTEHSASNPNDDYKGSNECLKISPDSPLPQVPEVSGRSFSEGDADQRKTDLSQDATELRNPNPNDDSKPVTERPNTSPEFPLPQVPEVPLRRFSEGNADQRKKELSQDVTESTVQTVVEKEKRKPFHLGAKKEVDLFRLFLRNVSPITRRELIVSYLEYCCSAIPIEIDFKLLGALVLFSAKPDVEKLQVKVKEKPLEGHYIQVARVPLTSQVLLSGLLPSITRDMIERHFDTEHSGGGPITDVIFGTDKQLCVVTFENVEDAERACKRPHIIDNKDIQICLYYECLDGDFQKYNVQGLFLVLRQAQVNFIQRYKKEYIKDLEKRFENSYVRISIVDHGDQKGIQINGTKDGCNAVKTELNKLAKMVMTKEHKMQDERELRTFLESPEGRDQLNAVTRKCKCILTIEGISSSLHPEGRSQDSSSDSEDGKNEEPMARGGTSTDAAGKDVSVDQTVLTVPDSSSPSEISEVLPTYKYALSQSVVMEIVQGDITKETTDAIINSVLPSLDLSKGQVSKAILTAGGNSIQQECLNKFTDLNRDGFVVTKPGQLPCKMIIHVLVQDKRRDVEDMIKRVLRRAEMLKLQSISFPAIGTGGRGLPEEMMVKAIYKAFREFACSEPKFLKKIRLVVFKVAMFNTIKGQVELKYNKPSNFLDKFKKVWSKEKSIVFSITVDSESNFQAVIRELDGFQKN